jgi:hypothetical protein
MVSATKFSAKLSIHIQKYSRLVELGFSRGTFTIPKDPCFINIITMHIHNYFIPDSAGFHFGSMIQLPHKRKDGDAFISFVMMKTFLALQQIKIAGKLKISSTSNKTSV